MNGRQFFGWQSAAIAATLAIAMAPVAGKAAQPFEGQTWQLLGWTSEGTPQVLVENVDLTIQFNQGQVNGSGGCNRFVGRYTFGASQLSMGGPVATTKKACPPEVQSQEDLFIAALQGAAGFDVTSQGNLRIAYTNAQGSGVLIFQPPQPAIQPIAPPPFVQTTPAPPASTVPALW